MIKTYYVYMHRQADTLSPFYIGKGYRTNYGKYDRANDFCRRKRMWKSVKARHGVEVEILAEFFNEDHALEYEAIVIREYGRRDSGTGILVNHTDGGKGASGYKMSESCIEKLRERNRRRIRTDEYKAKMSKLFSGNCHPLYGTKNSQETIEKKRQSMLGKQKGGNSPLAKKVIDESTGVVYLSTRDAAESLGIAMTTLAHKLNGIRRNTTSMRFL